MLEKTPIQRGIQNKWKVNYHHNSPTHTAGMLLAPGNWAAFDPFLIMAEDWFQKGTFGLHPHRGIETITYVIEGKLEHFDNKAGKGELQPGDVQWMTAGRGVLHSEEPAEGETVHSLQLWVNLPGDMKMTAPRYQNLKKDDVPIWQEDGATVKIFSGTSNGIVANTLNHTPITMLEIELEPGKTINQSLQGDYNGFLYILEGKGKFGKDNTKGEKSDILWLTYPDESRESEIIIHAVDNLKCLLYAGKPIRENVVARGPFVMNSEEEIAQAYSDYRSGQFGE